MSFSRNVHSFCPAINLHRENGDLIILKTERIFGAA